jgi:hypothetical protein
MSYAAEQQDTRRKGWLHNKKLLLFAAIVILLGTGVIILISAFSSPIPEGGGLIIEADPGTRIYVGDKLVGTRKVSFSWGQLLGDENHEALATKVSDNDWGELPANEAASILKIDSIGVVNTTNVFVSGSGYFFRRRDGSLDQVFAIILRSPPNQTRTIFRLPVRLRKGEKPSTPYFTVRTGLTNPSSFNRNLGRSPNESTAMIRFTVQIPPSETAEEIETSGLWEPKSK